MNRDFWKNKKVFLTGHTGFKGAWASLWLHDMGAKVFGYSLSAPTEPSLYQAAGVASFVHEKIADITQYSVLSNAMSEVQPDIVIHMAAQPLVRYSYDHPIETYNTNVMGTISVLEAVRAVKSIKSVVVVTTDKCYENVEADVAYKEIDPMGGYDPYSSSKGCAELVVSAWRRSYFGDSSSHIASVRAGNVVGGGDWAKDRLIPDFMRHFAEQKEVLVRNPNAIRPWQHVMEPLSGYFTLAEKLYVEGKGYAEAWNFGPQQMDARNVEYIANMLSKLWGEGCRWRVDKGPHPHEATYLKLNIDKSRSRLNWRPILNIDETLSLTCSWYKDFYTNKASAYDITLKQIKDYESRV